MKPIWYFVGILLMIIGAIIVAAGIYTLFYPPQEQKILASMHPDLWWGGVMVISGFVFLMANRNKTIG